MRAAHNRRLGSDVKISGSRAKSLPARLPGTTYAMATILDRKTLSWALYDWANSAFSTTVMAAFFPVFMKQYWGEGADPLVSTSRLGIANSIASLVLVVIGPVLGAIADRGGRRRTFLLCFAGLGFVMTGSMFFISRGAWPLAITAYVLAGIGFAGGNIFYDALLVDVADKGRRDLVSAFGFATGYLGGGILLALNVLMTVRPTAFGLANASVAVRVSFLTVAVWWALFSIPLFLFVKEPAVASGRSALGAVSAGFRQLGKTFRQLRKLRSVWIFLLGYWLYIDGVDTIMRMAVDFGMNLGFDPGSLITALLITQFIGFPAALAFGKIGERIGAKRGILIGLSVYCGVCIWGCAMSTIREFYVLAAVVGLVQGGVQALSRSLYSRLIPAGQAGEFFGFYNLLGKTAAVIGPVLMGWIGLLTGNPRYALVSLIVLFVLGAAILGLVDEESRGMDEK